MLKKLVYLQVYWRHDTSKKQNMMNSGVYFVDIGEVLHKVTS